MVATCTHLSGAHNWIRQSLVGIRKCSRRMYRSKYHHSNKCSSLNIRWCRFGTKFLNNPSQCSCIESRPLHRCKRHRLSMAAIRNHPNRFHSANRWNLLRIHTRFSMSLAPLCMYHYSSTAYSRTADARWSLFRSEIRWNRVDKCTDSHL